MAGDETGEGLGSGWEGDAGVRNSAVEPDVLRELVLRELEDSRGRPIGLEMSEPGRAGKRRIAKPHSELGASDAVVPPDARSAEGRRGGFGGGFGDGSSITGI